jgi:hypothetical protein
MSPVMPAAPAVFFETPRIEDVVRVVNENSGRIRQIQTTGATLSTQGYDLRADMAFDRPRRFRLKAGTMLTGGELDLGSNDELVWMWVDRLRPSAVYFARHDDIQQGRLRESFPISPELFIEAMGLIWLDPSAPHEGPWRRQPGRIEIRSPVRLRGAEFWRNTVLDDTRGWILEQRVTDRQGQLVALSMTSDHRYDAANGVSLPHRIQLSIPLASIDFHLRVDQYLVNQLYTDPGALFEMPRPSGAAVLDLANPKTPSPFRSAPQVGLRPDERAGDAPRISERTWLRRYNGFDELR